MLKMSRALWEVIEKIGFELGLPRLKLFSEFCSGIHNVEVIYY